MPAPASLSVVKDTHTFHLAVNEAFPFDEDVLYCAKIEPVVKKGNATIEFLHFSSFRLLTNKIVFEGDSFVALRSGTHYTLTVVEPVMIPLPSNLNQKIAATNAFCRIQLFFRVGDQPKYIGNIGCLWNLAPKAIKQMIRGAGIGFKNLWVGSVESANTIPGDIQMLDQFFADKSKGRELMILYCEADRSMVLECGGITVSTSQLPRVPRILANLTSKRMKMVADESKKASMRRILGVCANSGIMVHMLDDQLNIQYGNRVIKSSDFARIQLNWETSLKMNITDNLFSLPNEGFKNLLKSSNEATLGGLFWTGALNAALLPGLQSGKLRSIQEWNTDTLLPKFHKRRVDFVAALHCFPPDTPGPNGLVKSLYPIAFAEYGRKTVEIDKEHKDSGKSGCLASALCLRLAYKLVSVGLRPELARCYGLMVGGTGARLIVACPVVRETRGGGEFEIEIHVSCVKTWNIDLLSGHGAAREVTEERPLETLLPADEQCPNWNEFNLVEVEDVGGVPINIETEEQHVSANVSTLIDDENDSTFQAGASAFGLSQIKFVGQLILESADTICTNNEASRESANRIFKAAPKYGFLPAGRASSIAETPEKGQVGEYVPPKTPSTPIAQTSIRQPVNEIELMVYKEASVFFPGFLPRIYDIKEPVGENENVEYLMEHLEPFATDLSGLHPFFAASGAKNVLFAASKFMLDSLFQLHIIHEQLQIVHANVSPSNIMYSKADRIWKLINFDHAQYMAESESTKRVAGTPEFIAPETIESGIFTAASDVWALGEIALNWLMPSLTMEVYFESDDSDNESGRRNADEWMQQCCDTVVNAIFEMASSRPSDRPTVVEAIKVFYSVISRFETCHDANDLVLEGSRNLIRSVQSKARATPVASVASTASKSTAHVVLSPVKRRLEEPLHEKDPLQTEIPRVQ